MSWVMVDIEADGPIPGDYSMISLGAVVVDQLLDKRFYTTLKPISDRFVPSALKVCGFTHEETLGFTNPRIAMSNFRKWIDENSIGRPMFISDNNGFDWMFTHWYMIHFFGDDPFGHSSTNLGSLYKGCVRNFRENFKHLREQKHTHNALDDAVGNAQALLIINNKFSLRML
jgi:DNA polymerase III epsilon subunit-like protein